jgi:transposase-like protein
MTQTRLEEALAYSREHGTTMTQTADAIGISTNALANYVVIARRRGQTIEFPKAPRKPPTSRVSTHLARALEYAREHGTTLTQTARALGIDLNALNCAAVRARKAGVRVEWGTGERRATPEPEHKPRASSDPSDVPISDLIRHVRNGTTFWEVRRPMGDPGRGPSAPVYPAEADSLRRHNTISGLAWRWAVDVATVEAARVRMGMGAFLTDGQARLLGMALGVCS